ncbi:hypothetical protein [Chryseobacterium pennipullorum]|uniref:DUF4252 domain-containing protein n=1 Tax=Chryseobacterium pennipullorum TaxID=2258963 RepID=A0A3D9AZM7_9FLAO|nr:hypothetical protein [Chryseobacterium pennipullorum]REC46406.1 hypothetical protein DRF67_14090 [Chryseobacterium pennipullorum]
MMKNIFFSLAFMTSQFIFAQSGNRFAINDVLIKFPKEVELRDLNKVAGQYFFVDKAKSNIQVSVKNADKMEFYNAAFTKTELLDAFYRWDFDYWKTNSIGGEVKEISKDLDKNQILWEVTLKEGKTIFLFGILEDKLISISIHNARLSDEEQINFVTKVYRQISKYKK